MRAARLNTSWRVIVAALALAVSGCATVGQGFDPAGIAYLVPGQTTLDDAGVLLKAPPSQTYRNADGAMNAMWYAGMQGPVDSHIARSATLAFDSLGRFRRVVDTHNIVVDQVAADRQRRQAQCLSRGLAWPCDAPVAPTMPVAVTPPRPAPVAPLPADCRAEGPSVLICPTL